ncbi:hypothetical protein GCM10010435_83170 [Winogradskya consettensis]|uniref:Uncharacterized protein n=1 Tax=Winogradskya consettensis TaxID=113560 RepID=A0A919VZP1_9ACTN|nr:hypothetical protein Aco04nite_80930 [Actinoplanes consettensis]
MLLAEAGPGVDTPLLKVEVRQLGGALAVTAPDAGAVSGTAARFALFTGAAGAPGMAETLRAPLHAPNETFQQWTTGQRQVNFLSRYDSDVATVRSAYSSESWNGYVTSSADTIRAIFSVSTTTSHPPNRHKNTIRAARVADRPVWHDAGAPGPSVTDLIIVLEAFFDVPVAAGVGGQVVFEARPAAVSRTPAGLGLPLSTGTSAI